MSQWLASYDRVIETAEQGLSVGYSNLMSKRQVVARGGVSRHNFCSAGRYATQVMRMVRPTPSLGGPPVGPLDLMAFDLIPFVMP